MGVLVIGLSFRYAKGEEEGDRREIEKEAFMEASYWPRMFNIFRG